MISRFSRYSVPYAAAIFALHKNNQVITARSESARVASEKSGSLLGKTALVTGSTSGIGCAVAEGLCAEGCNVVLNGFGNPSQIEELRQHLSNEYGVEVRFFPTDMSKPEEITQMMTDVGELDILVNNAGIQYVSPIEDFPQHKWEQIVAINMSSAFYTTKAAIAGMKERGYGRIINVASAHGLVGSPNKSAYVASKHGVIGLTKVGG
jgi:3-hydroxybutyrate dehydrogenase